MNKKKAYPIRNGVLIAVISSLIISVIPFTWAWGIVKSVSGSIWGHFSSSTNVPLFLIWILLLLSIPTLIRLLKRIFPSKECEPRIADYNEDVIRGIKWKWSYWGHTPTNFSSFCPTCDTRLIYSLSYYPDRTTFSCETCHREVATLDGDRDFAEGSIARQIERTVNSGDWKKRLQSTAE